MYPHHRNKQPFEHLELADLPRLPVPKLKETLERYREALMPLIETKEELARLDKHIKGFFFFFFFFFSSLSILGYRFAVRGRRFAPESTFGPGRGITDFLGRGNLGFGCVSGA